MRFYTIKPGYFVIRTEDEKKLLDNILKKVGITLTPVCTTQTVQEILQHQAQRSSEDTQSIPVHTQETDPDELPDNGHTSRANPLARSTSG